VDAGAQQAAQPQRNTNNGTRGHRATRQRRQDVASGQHHVRDLGATCGEFGQAANQAGMHHCVACVSFHFSFFIYFIKTYKSLSTFRDVFLNTPKLQNRATSITQKWIKEGDIEVPSHALAQELRLDVETG
jgi:hypothetical protein